MSTLLKRVEADFPSACKAGHQARVMAAIIADHKGRLDGKAASALVRERLSS